jgi:crotonobetaine/carnitine-CoA ligase
MNCRIPYEDRLFDTLLRRQAVLRPEREFLADERRVLSYGLAAVGVDRIAGGLRDIGVQPGDRVALMLPNCVEFVLFWMACARLSATCVFLNPDYKGDMVDYVFDDARPCGLVTHADVIDNLRSGSGSALAGLQWVCTLGSPPSKDWHGRRDISPQSLFMSSPITDPPALDPGAPNCVVYTSGTTGPSKGVILSSSALLSGSCTFVEIAELTSEDTLYTPLPLFHGLASRQGVMGCLIAGAKVYLGERFSVSRFWRHARASEATVAHTMFNIPSMLKAQPDEPTDRVHRLRVMYNANQDDEFELRFGVPLVESYGLVETGITIYAPLSERVPGSCGRLHRDWDARIVDAEGVEVADGTAGELLLRPRAPGLFMEGYLNKPQATQDACVDGWFRTGDFMRREAGHYFFAGRQKERIRRRGENISPWELERIVGRHPAVSLCAAVRHPADVGDDDVRLVLTLKEGAALQPRALSEWLVDRTPRFMLPRYIEIVERLPLTPTKKVRKNELIDAGLGPTAWDAQRDGYLPRGQESRASAAARRP